jgi:hypothetical protein
MTLTAMSATPSTTHLLPRLIEFVRAIGIDISLATVPDNTSLPGLTVNQGAVILDQEKLRWPGDLIHEAGHIATCPPSRRASLDGKLNVSPAEEMAVLAWSYAVAVHLGIDPLIIFHEGGYQGSGAQLAAQYASGLPPGGPGVPMLQWWGMTTAFPQMTLWVRLTEDPA